jgi:hypothetical protein
LDLYRGQFDFTNFSTQVHDFDPGIHPYPAGLFWTQTGIHLGGINLEEGTAHMSASHLPERDFFNLPNALFRFQTPVSVEASASFDIHWEWARHKFRPSHDVGYVRAAIDVPGQHDVVGEEQSWVQVRL